MGLPSPVVMDYAMSPSEQSRAESADGLLNAFSGSYKPNLLPHVGRVKNGGAQTYTVYAEDSGYYLVCETAVGVRSILAGPKQTAGEYLQAALSALCGCEYTLGQVFGNRAVERYIEYHDVTVHYEKR